MLVFSRLRHHVRMNQVYVLDFCEATEIMIVNQTINQFVSIWRVGDCSHNLLFAWLQLLQVIKIVDTELRHLQLNRKLPLHRRRETVTVEKKKNKEEGNVWDSRLNYSFACAMKLTSPTSISKISTPNPHQSTALVYDVSVRTGLFFFFF